MRASSSRFYVRGIGQTRTLNIAPALSAYLSQQQAAADRAAAPAPAPSSGPSFWDNASTTEKVVIVGAGVGTLALLFLAFRPKRRR